MCFTRYTYRRVSVAYLQAQSHVQIFFFFRDELIDERIERRVSAMRAVVDLARVLRERKAISFKVGVSLSSNSFEYTLSLSQISLMQINTVCRVRMLCSA